MTKEEFIIRLIEQQIFDELKDGYFSGINYIRMKYEGSGIDFSRLYRRIVNYRIREYGTSSFPNLTDYYRSDERLKQNQNIKRARRNRLR